MDESLFPGNQGGQDGNDLPPIPPAKVPPSDWPHRELYERVIEALYVLPSRFESELRVTGVLATDLHTFNTSLGATIEAQVTEALNELREVWDPSREYTRYGFVRQSQRFPDVILRSSVPDLEPQIIMGIELKGWYALSKEAEPSFRFRASPKVCAPQDLLVVYPWALSEVVSGQPELYAPFVIGARTAAERRNWYWQYVMEGGSITDRTVRLSEVNEYYPDARAAISDAPAQDQGNNFGRVARTRLMDEWTETVRQETLSGIPLGAWQRFLKIFSDNRTKEKQLRSLETGITTIAKNYAPPGRELPEGRAREILDRIIEIAELSAED